MVKFLSTENLFKLLNNLEKDYSVYLPVKTKKQRSYKRYTGPLDDIMIGEVRAFEPLKAFFSRSREKVAEGFSPDAPHAKDRPFAIVGVKACDLKGFKIQDFVFKDHDYQDPFYMKNRSENLIISSDCTIAIETCFCMAVGIKPHPVEDFDINLSPVSGGFVAFAQSARGKDLLAQNQQIFLNASEAQLSQKDNQRSKVIREVEYNIKKNNIPMQESFKGIIEKNFDAQVWKDEALRCVECACCTAICPTCHCFLLYDQMDKDKMERLRTWDSCMIKDYARVAGGANPRPKLWMRLRNRFEKKFDFFPKVANVYACTGCGRCISGCPAEIDIRKVLRKLVDNA